MRLETTILRSKVARRVFLLFLACAIFPTVVLTVLSSRLISAQLEEESRRQLRQTTKAVGMAILGKLAGVESELRIVAEVVLPGSDPGDASAWERIRQHLEPRVRGMAVVSAGRVERLFGEDPPALVPWGSAGSPLSPGTALLELVYDGHGRARVLLGLALDGADQPALLVAEVDPGYLWSVEEDLRLSPGRILWIFDADGRILATTGEGADASSDAFPIFQASAHREFRCLRDGREQRGHGWLLFLQAQYGSPNWTVVVTEPVEDSLGALAWASKILPLTILLCVLIVSLLSLVQIRKSLVPIVTLQAGTQQIAASNFDARVSVRSKDEFSQLADSFNAMASRLGAQFKTLRTVAQIDREMLSTLREDEIVGTLLAWAPDRFRCDRVAVTLAHAGDRNAGTIYSRDGAVTGAHSTVLTDAEHPWLSGPAAEPQELRVEALPPNLAGVLGSDLASCLVVPIRRNAINGYLALGSRDSNRWTSEERTEARRLADQAGIALSNARLLEQLERVNRETLHALARAVDANSPWTAGHSERVTRMALKLSRQLGLGEEERAVLHRGGLLHDVGKIGVPGHIVDKPGRLTDEELAVMREHVRIGASILGPISGYQREVPIVLYHHERYDGRGYPEGLAGQAIPYLARILTVADVFDAVISERPYRRGWEVSRVVDFIAGAAGTQFDPDVVTAFLDLAAAEDWRECPRGEETWMIGDFNVDADTQVLARS